MTEQDWKDLIQKSRYSRSVIDREIKIFDTTLRDGEQSSGIALSKDDKIALAKVIDDLGADCIEVGFAVSGETEKETVKAIVGLGLNADIYSLARCKRKDIDAVAETGARHVHMFIATSDIHLKDKLGMTREQILDAVKDSVSYAKEKGLNVQFSCEDATRTDIDFLKKVYRTAIDSGAGSIDVPDTVGISVPDGISNIISQLRSEFDVPIAVHCHNDMGLATANSLAAAEHGADIIHATINGIGERAGNASLEEVAVALLVNYGVRTVDLQKMYVASSTVSRYTGYPISYNKAIVGRNAFSHESGIHVHGLIKNASTYEAFPPELVGRSRSIAIGKMSGEHSIRSRLDSMNISFPEDLMLQLIENVKNLAISGKDVTDLELAALAENVLWKGRVASDVTLKEFIVVSGKNATPTATVTIDIRGKERTCAETGIGPVDAAFNAIRRVFEDSFEIEDFRLEAITGGSDALCEVTLMIKDTRTSKVTAGKCIGMDIVQTSVDAIMEAINRDYSDQ